MVQDSSLRAQAQKVKDLTAFHHRDEGYHLIAVALWDDPGDDEKNSRCARKAWKGCNLRIGGSLRRWDGR